MKKTLCVMLLIFLWTATNALAAGSPVGKWKTIDDKTKEATSIVEVYEQGGVIFVMRQMHRRRFK
jgi:hypothetical protein